MKGKYEYTNFEKMQDLQKAIKIIQDGGIVIYPTDTVFGLGCRIDDKAAVKRLFALKKRSEKQSVSVLVDSTAMAETYLLPIPETVKKQLMEVYWPGGLTIILPCNTKKVLPLIRGGGQTLGVRVPDHPLTRSLIHGVGIPITGTSANFHGEKTPAMIEDLDRELVKQVDFVLPGACYNGISSTIIDCSINPWKTLRNGVVRISNSVII